MNEAYGQSVSASDRWVYHNLQNESKELIKLNNEQAVLHLPITTFLVLLMTFGVAGNTCVIYVYRTRYRKTSGSFFIMSLAILDLINSLLCIPWEISLLANPYFQDWPVLCKIARFCCSTVYLLAGLILVCVAFSRYFKVIRPLHYYTSGQAQSLTIVMLWLAICLVWPQLALSGTRTVVTRIPGLTGQQCTIADKFQGTIYPLLFLGSLYGVFALSFALITGFYLHIITVVWSRGKKRLGQQVAHRDYVPRSSASLSNLSDRSNGSSQNISVTSRSNAGTHSHRSFERTSKTSRLGRTTRMLTLVTFVFLLGYLPFLTVQFLYLLGYAFQEPRTYPEDLVFQLCRRSYFLSSAANPLIYSILNLKFRRESMVALKKLILKLPLWIRKHVKGEHEVP